MKKEMITCCICGDKIPMNESHNPYPVRDESCGEEVNRCCVRCNDMIVQRARTGAFLRGDIIYRQTYAAKLKKMSFEELRKTFC